jgi:mono/diheme cytochrome c family protein
MIGRMLVEKMENRILLGVLMFIGIMLMVGWVAINENARMASFTQQYEARSIERGAELFAANCSTCHANDGRGIQGRAPALNNPHLFGFDFAAESRGVLTDLQEQQTALQDERLALQEELDAEEGVTDERRAEIDTRLVEIEELLAPEAELAQGIAAAQTEYDAYLTSIQTAIDNGYVDTQPSRLAQANWTGTLDAYIYTTLVHGRGQNAAMWPGNVVMAAWSQRAGGPLRDDQIQDLVNYITNWDKGDDWTLEDLLAVNQFAQVPGGSGGRPEPSAPPVGEIAVEEVLAQWEAQGIVGDPVRGDELYHNREWSQLAERLGCAGCHEGGAQGPATEGTWDRVVNERLTLPEFAGYTPEEYIVESILYPDAYVVPPYPNVMPNNFPQRTSLQDLADLVEYLRTTSADYVPPADTGAEESETDNIGGSVDGETQQGMNVDATPEGAQQAP